MAEEVLLVREGSKLAASDPISAEAIERIGHKEQVKATLVRIRNPRHHRKFFLMLNEIFRNQAKHATLEDLLSAVKIGTGHCTWVAITLRGLPVQVAIPKSIAWANMGQTSFEQFYNRAVEYIITEIIPGLDKAGLEDRIIEMLATHGG